MKLLTYSENGIELLGVLSSCEKNIIPLKDNGFNFKDMNSLIETITKEEKEAINNLVSSADAKGVISYENTKILAPIPKPNQEIICLGINYMEHAVESVRYKKEDFDGTREYPVYFGKRVSRASGDKDPIPSYSDFVSTLDYEAELGVIIGKTAKNVSVEDAYDYVFGYTIINDVTARELQSRHKQWLFGKGLDGFTPMGPVIVTADEIQAPPVLTIKSYINGELRQNSKTDLLIHNIPYVINELSKGIALLPGTIIATGTPAGVGMGFTPPKFLNKGDEVVCEIENIGKITNIVE